MARSFYNVFQMYRKLWCDVSLDTDCGTRKRINPESGGSSRKEKEDTVGKICLNNMKNLRARMISCGTHDDYNEPPDSAYYWHCTKASKN